MLVVKTDHLAGLADVRLARPLALLYLEPDDRSVGQLDRLPASRQVALNDNFLSLDGYRKLFSLIPATERISLKGTLPFNDGRPKNDDIVAELTSRLPHLVSLNFGQVSSVGLEAVGKLAELKNLQIGVVASEPADVEALARFRNLEKLAVTCTKTSLPPWLPVEVSVGDAIARIAGEMPTLRSLYIGIGTPVGEKGLEAIAKLKGLEDLRVELTEVDDQSIAPIGRLAGLRTLWVGGGGKLSDAGLAQLKELSLLTILTLPGNGLTDAALSRLAPLTSLRRFKLRGGRFTDDGLAALEPLKRLSALDLSSWEFDDDGCRLLPGFAPQLVALDLDGTKVTDAGLAELARLKNLARLRVTGTGATPQGVAALKSALPQLVVVEDESWRGKSEVLSLSEKEAAEPANTKPQRNETSGEDKVGPALKGAKVEGKAAVPTSLDDAALRAALPARPGYEWFWGPTAELAHVDGVYSSDVAITIAQDFEKALLVTVSETDESIVLVNVAAFDEQKSRYDLHAHSIGGSDHLSTYCFRLDPAKLPRDKVAYLGVEVMQRNDPAGTQTAAPAGENVGAPAAEAGEGQHSSGYPAEIELSRGIRIGKEGAIGLPVGGLVLVNGLEKPPLPPLPKGTRVEQREGEGFLGLRFVVPDGSWMVLNPLVDPESIPKLAFWELCQFATIAPSIQPAISELERLAGRSNGGAVSLDDFRALVAGLGVPLSQLDLAMLCSWVVKVQKGGPKASEIAEVFAAKRAAISSMTCSSETVYEARLAKFDRGNERCVRDVFVMKPNKYLLDRKFGPSLDQLSRRIVRSYDGKVVRECDYSGNGGKSANIMAFNGVGWYLRDNGILCQTMLLNSAVDTDNNDTSNDLAKTVARLLVFQRPVDVDGVSCIACTDFGLGNVYYLSPKMNFALVKIEKGKFGPVGGLEKYGQTADYGETTLEQLRDCGNGIWLPSRIKTAWYQDGREAQHQTTTVSEIAINPEVDDDLFVKTITPGTVVVDSVKQISYTEGNVISLDVTTRNTAVTPQGTAALEAVWSAKAVDKPAAADRPAADPPADEQTAEPTRATATPPNQNSVATADLDPVGRIERLWIDQGNQIKTAAIDYRSFSAVNGQPSDGSGDVKPLSVDEVEQVFAQVDLAAHPDRIGDVLAKLMKEPPKANALSPTIHFYQDGTKRAVQSDRGARFVGPGLAIHFDAIKKQADVYSDWASADHMESLADFRSQPSKSRGTWHFVGQRDGLVHFQGTDHEDFFFDEATGVLSRMLVRNTIYPITSLRMESGPVNYPGGVVFPSLTVVAQFADGRLRSVSLTLIEKATFNERIDPAALEHPCSRRDVSDRPPSATATSPTNGEGRSAQSCGFLAFGWDADGKMIVRSYR